MEFIYDRIESDLLNNTPKAYINYSDLNRIERNIYAISQMIESMPVTDVKLNWQSQTATAVTSNFPLVNQCERIMSSIKKLADKIELALPVDFPDNFNNATIYGINAIEKYLHDAYEFLKSNNVEANLKDYLFGLTTDSNGREYYLQKTEDIYEYIGFELLSRPETTTTRFIIDVLTEIPSDLTKTLDFQTSESSILIRPGYPYSDYSIPFEPKKLTQLGEPLIEINGKLKKYQHIRLDTTVTVPEAGSSILVELGFISEVENSNILIQRIYQKLFN